MTTVDTETREITEFQTMDDAEFLDNLAARKVMLEQRDILYGQAVQEAHRRLRETGAKKLYGNGLEYVDETKSEPNRSQIPPLMEYLTPAEIMKCKAVGHYAEPVWVEDKYDLTQVKKAMKDHGGDGQKALDNIYMPGAAKGKLVKT